MNKTINIIYDLWEKWCRYRYVDPIFSFARLCLVTGASLAAGGLGWAFTALIPKLNIPVTVGFGPQQPIALGAILIAFGLGLGIWRIKIGTNRVGCFLICHQGMLGMELGYPENDLPGKYKTGQIRKIHIDYASDKLKILRKIDALNERLKQDLADGASAKADLVYAGLAPIPYLFYSGFVISSRKRCDMILEWDRSAGHWHVPDKPKQDLSFVVEKPSGQVVEELAIAMPLSVEFGAGPVVKAINGLPVMWLRLPDGASQDSLSNKYDQQALAKEFYDILAGIRNSHQKVNRVHLFIAAQASFVFYLGQQYSSSVHPPVCIYNFLARENRYEWKLVIDGETTIENMTE